MVAWLHSFWYNSESPSYAQQHFLIFVGLTLFNDAYDRTMPSSNENKIVYSSEIQGNGNIVIFLHHNDRNSICVFNALYVDVFRNPRASCGCCLLCDVDLS